MGVESKKHPERVEKNKTSDEERTGEIILAARTGELEQLKFLPS